MSEREGPPPDPMATAKNDLRWYFEEAEGALGARAQTYDPSGSGGVVPEQVAERQAEAYLREIKVRRRLAEIGAHARVLACAFTPTPPSWPIRREAGWYESGGVAALLVDAEDLFGGARRIAALEDQKLLADWRRYAQETLSAALCAFVGRRVLDVEMPLVAPPRPKQKPEAPRTWVPMAEHRAAPDGVGEKPADWWQRQATRRSSSDR